MLRYVSKIAPQSSAKCNKPPQSDHDTSRTKTAKSWYSNNHPDISRIIGNMAGVPLPDAFVNSAENRRFCALKQMTATSRSAVQYVMCIQS